MGSVSVTEIAFQDGAVEIDFTGFFRWRNHSSPIHMRRRGCLAGFAVV